MRQKEEASTAAFSPFECYTSLSTPAHFHLGPHHYRSIISHISNSGRARRVWLDFRPPVLVSLCPQRSWTSLAFSGVTFRGSCDLLDSQDYSRYRSAP